MKNPQQGTSRTVAVTRTRTDWILVALRVNWINQYAALTQQIKKADQDTRKCGRSLGLYIPSLPWHQSNSLKILTATTMMMAMAAGFKNRMGLDSSFGGGWFFCTGKGWECGWSSGSG